MKAKFYKGDTVEILNLSNVQVNDIRSQTCQTNADLSHIIGMRYKIDDSSNIFHTLVSHKMAGWNHGGNVSDWFLEDQLRIVYRPIKNWFRLFKSTPTP